MNSQERHGNIDRALQWAILHLTQGASPTQEIAFAAPKQKHSTRRIDAQSAWTISGQCNRDSTDHVDTIYSTDHDGPIAGMGASHG